MRHTYFAYGSNLCVRQMARRCPGAVDPRPATLADHDWLINERGVATVEPFDGSQVHGVVWQLTDHDLATLDSAEGVPVRYRRDRLTVQTDDGPSAGVGLHRSSGRARAAAAGVFGAHRRRCTAPRSSAAMDRLPAGDGIPRSGREVLSKSSAPAPQSLSELLAEPSIIEEVTLRSRFGFMAIHGGGLEQMTDVIAERAADAADASLYVVRHPDHYPHHLPSALYLAPRNPNGSPSFSTTSTSRCRCTDTAGSGAARNCSPAAATARSPIISRATSACPATRWSPTSARSPVSCGACIRTTR